MRGSLADHRLGSVEVVVVIVQEELGHRQDADRVIRELELLRKTFGCKWDGPFT